MRNRVTSPNTAVNVPPSLDGTQQRLYRHVYTIFLVLLIIQSAAPATTPLVYISIIALSLAVVFSRHPITLNLTACIAVLAALLLSVAAAEAISARTIRDACVIVTSVLILAGPQLVDRTAVQRTMLALLCSLAVQGANGRLQYVSAFDLAGSEGLLESELSFTFAVALIFFTYRRKKLWAALCLAAMILTFKRMAFIALGTSFVALSIYYLVWPGQTSRLARFIYLAMFVAITAAVALSADKLFEFVATNFFPEQSANQLSFGRFNMLNWSMQYFQAGPILNQLFGYGPGRINELFFQVWRPGFEHAHNDYMKILFDYGWVGFSLILFAFIALFSRNVPTMAAGYATMLIFMTDNTLIYVTFMIPLAYCCLTVQSSRSSPSGLGD